MIASSLAGILYIVDGCSRLHHVSGESFIATAERLPTTVYGSDYLGISGGSAYLVESQMYPLLGFRKSVVWTELTELPPAVVAELKAGQNPWSLKRRAAASQSPATQPADKLHL